LNIESFVYCFGGGSCDIKLCTNNVEIAMPIERFDAYGEVLPDAARGEREAASAGSVALARVGQYVFWLLVIVIVSARIIFYPATPVFEVGTATDVKHMVTR
jgi:hypothetical protein